MELSKLLSDDLEKQILYISLYYADTSYSRRIFEKLCIDNPENNYLKELKLKDKDITTSMTLLNLTSKTQYLSGLYDATGNNQIIQKIISEASTLWREETLNEDISQFYQGMILHNTLLEWIIKHNRIENYCKEYVLSTKNETEKNLINKTLEITKKVKNTPITINTKEEK